MTTVEDFDMFGSVGIIERYGGVDIEDVSGTLGKDEMFGESGEEF